MLSELDPTNGSTVRFIPGRHFPNGVAPVVSNGKLWIYEKMPNLVDPGVSVFDLTTFSFVRQFAGGRSDLNSSYDGPGALTTDAFVLDYGNIYGQPGFDVYLTPVPEPSGALALALAGLGAWAWRRRPGRRG
jgi:hypothetical protein